MKTIFKDYLDIFLKYPKNWEKIMKNIQKNAEFTIMPGLIFQVIGMNTNLMKNIWIKIIQSISEKY